MLSFDITDRNIRVVKGADSGNRVRIISGATLNLEEEVIANGHVRDIPRLATLVTDILRMNKMGDKEAMVCISSNLTIFKELNIPRPAKESDFDKLVKAEMYSAMNINEQYSVSYIVVGNVEGADVPTAKVLATACPFEIIDGYKKVFSLIGLSLKSVMVGCNSIAKVILADPQIRSKMPCLAVQVDDTFISLNIFDRDQLAFSRFASIDPDDYGNSDDYVFEAVSENIFRMLQFHKAQGGAETIGNVILYGDTKDYNRIAESLREMEVQTSIVEVPHQVSNAGSLQFPLYANAVGAMFKRNKLTEKVNLLETDSKNNNKLKNDNTFMAVVIAGLLVAGAGYTAGGMWFNIQNKNIKSETAEIVARINSDDIKKQQAEVARLDGVLAKVMEYKNRAQNAIDAYNTHRVLDSEMILEMDEALERAMRLNNTEIFEIKAISFTEDSFSFAFKGEDRDDYSKKLPAILMRELEALDFVESSAYSGYSVSRDKKEENDKVTVSFSVNLTLKPGIYQVPELSEEPDDDEAADAA